MADITLDPLSVGLLAAVLALAVVHLVFLRKPEPPIHPLLLGRQSELARVRKPNESPVFLSASAGLGGVAKQLLRDVSSISEAWQGKGAKILLGLAGSPDSVDAKVSGVRQAFGQCARPLTIKLDDPADAFLAILAASSSDVASPPLVLSSQQGLASHARTPLVVSPSDAAVTRDIRAHDGQDKTVYLVHSAQRSPQVPVGPVPSSWNAKDIYMDKIQGTSDNSEMAVAPGKDKASENPVFRALLHMPAGDAQAVVASKNLIQGGLVSLLSIFPPAEKPTSSDRILSFENTSSPYGFCVALAAAASGATLRLCSPHKGIISKCSTFSPNIIYCTPNELNAIRKVIQNQLPRGGAVVPLAIALKRSLLRAGTVTRTTLWDNLIFGKIRSAVVGNRLRCIVVSSDENAAPSNECIEFLRIVLGVPIIVTLTHSLVAGPISNTLYHDYQWFPNQGAYAHVGCPSAGVECKLMGAHEESALEGNYRGELAVKGPSVLRDVTYEDASKQTSGEGGWTRTGIWAELRTNGTMRIIKAV